MSTLLSRSPLALMALVMVLGACKPDPKSQPSQDAPAADKPADAASQKPADQAAQKPADGADQAKPGESGSVEAASEGGQWVKSDLYGAKFRVPEDWNVSIEADGITATDSDETTTLILVGSESEGMIQSAINDVKAKVKIKDAKFEKSGQVVLNGMPGQNVMGTAVLTKEDGMDQEIQFIAYNVKVGKKAVTMMIFSEAEMYEAKKEIIDGLAQTLTKTGP